MSGSAMDTLKGLLGDNADEKIKAALGALSTSGGEDTPAPIALSEAEEPLSGELVSQQQGPAFDTGTMESLMQIKSIVDNFTSTSNDSRSNLLLSLRPYMRSSRKSSIDTAIRLLNISKLSGIFKLR